MESSTLRGFHTDDLFLLKPFWAVNKKQLKKLKIDRLIH